MIDGKKLNQEEQIRAYAEIYARNLIMYGVDVREKLETATQMSFALNQAYMRGKQDECHRRWIPCSERLPEEEGKVLLTINLEGKKVIELGEHLGELEWCIYDEYYSCTYAKWEVIAWMPLPEPYKGGIDMNECCGTCKYHIYEEHTEEWICCNNRSEFIAEQTNDNHCCDEYVERT